MIIQEILFNSSIEKKIDLNTYHLSMATQEKITNRKISQKDISLVQNDQNDSNQIDDYEKNEKDLTKLKKYINEIENEQDSEKKNQKLDEVDEILNNNPLFQKAFERAAERVFEKKELEEKKKFRNSHRAVVLIGIGLFAFYIVYHTICAWRESKEQETNTFPSIIASLYSDIIHDVKQLFSFNNVLSVVIVIFLALFVNSLSTFFNYEGISFFSICLSFLIGIYTEKLKSTVTDPLVDKLPGFVENLFFNWFSNEDEKTIKFIIEKMNVIPEQQKKYMDYLENKQKEELNLKHFSDDSL